MYPAPLAGKHAVEEHGIRLHPAMVLQQLLFQHTPIILRHMSYFGMVMVVALTSCPLSVTIRTVPMYKPFVIPLDIR